MPRLNQVDPSTATGETKEIFDQLTSKMGKVVNIFQGMGNSPAALKAYLSASEALAGGELSTEDREAVYLAVSQQNGCNYCVAAHNMIAKGGGIAEDQIQKFRSFQADSPKVQALLTFVDQVKKENGFVADDQLQAVKDAGYTDGQIAEAVAYIGLATYSNLFNHVFDTPLDFPAAPAI